MLRVGWRGALLAGSCDSNNGFIALSVLPYFLVQKDVLDLSLSVPGLTLESTISPSKGFF